MLEKSGPKVNGAPAFDQEPATPTQTKNRFAWVASPTFLAFLGALALAVIYGRVAVFNLWSGVVGGDIDGYENLWNDYWTRDSLLHFRNPYFTDYMYYPTGISLRFHTLHPLTGLYALVAWPLLGPVASTNLLFVLSLALTTFFGYLLINDFVKRPVAAFAGAALFTYANDQVIGFFGAGQTEKLSAEWLPLYLFFMFRLVYRPHQWKRYAALSLLSLFLLNFTDWQYVIYAVLTTILFFVFLLFTRRSWREKGIIFARLAGVGALWGLIILFPLVLPMIKESSDNPWLSVSEQSVYHSLDILGYLKPDLTNPGYIPMLVMFFGVFVAWRRKETAEGARFWALCGTLAVLFTLGPKLIINGTLTEIPAPYALLYKLPVLSSGRDPGRFYTLALLAFGVLFGFGLKALLERGFFIPALREYARTTPRLGKVALNGVVVALLVFSLFGFVAESGKAEVNPLDTPAIYDQMAKDTEQYAVFEIPPFTENGRGENVYQVYQVIHNKPRFGGRWARDHKLANPNNFTKRETFYRDFFWLGTSLRDYYRPQKDFIPALDFSKIGLPMLNYWNARYMVIWKEAVVDKNGKPDNNLLEGYRKLLRAALGANAQPVYQNDRMEAYKVPDAPPLAEKLVLDVGNGWSNSEVNQEGPYRWADPKSGGPAELYVSNLSQQPVRAVLKAKLFNFVPQNGKQPRSVTVSINGYNAATYQFSENGEEKPVELEVTIPPGFNILIFSSPEPANPANPDRTKDARDLTFGARDITIAVK